MGGISGCCFEMEQVLSTEEEEERNVCPIPSVTKASDIKAFERLNASMVSTY